MVGLRCTLPPTGHRGRRVNYWPRATVIWTSRIVLDKHPSMLPIRMFSGECSGWKVKLISFHIYCRLMEELKKKQNTLQKDNPSIRALINRPPSTPNSNRGGRRYGTENLLSLYSMGKPGHDISRSKVN